MPTEGEALDRRMSSLSQARLMTLSDMETSVRAYEEQLDELERHTDSESLKPELRELAGMLETLQFAKLDAVMVGDLNSGKESAKQLRKDLHARIHALTTRVQNLYAGLDEEDKPRTVLPRHPAYHTFRTSPFFAVPWTY